LKALPTGWTANDLGNIVDFKTGKLNSNVAVANGAYPFFTCSQETFRTNTFAFDTECVLLAGNNANGIYPLKYFHGRFDAYQRTYVITPKNSEHLNTRFLYYALRPLLEHLKSISTGAATKFLTLTILNGLRLRFPPEPTQRKIAGILSAYDDLIENNTRRIAILEEMAQAIYREWFVHFRFPGHEKVKLVDSALGKIPVGWKVMSLFDVCEVAYGFPYKSKQFTVEPIGKPIIRIRDIIGHKSDTYTEEDAGPKYIVKNGDILIGMDGDFHMCRWAGGEAVLNQRVARLRTTGQLPQYVLFHVVKGPVEHFNATIVGTTVAHLGDKHLREINVVLPSLEILEEARLQFEPLHLEEINLRKRNELLRKTRDLLLPKLISGQVDVEGLEIEVPKSD